MTSYATLKEAYNIDTFNTPKKIRKKVIDTTETFMNDYSPQDDCYYKNQYSVDSGSCKNEVSKFTNYDNPSSIETSKLTQNSSVVKDYKSHQMNKQGKSCSPLQKPMYDQQVSTECKKEFDKTMKVYTDDITANTPSYSEFNKNMEMNNIQPYYDEEMEQYFDINNLSDGVNYKSNTSTNAVYLPNSNSKNYTNNNTNEYMNISNDDNDNLLDTNPYNLSEDDRKQALNALNTLKNIENKIKKTQEKAVVVEQSAKVEHVKTEPQEKTVKPTSTKSVFYSNLINICLFIFIGVAIILLCDQIAELAIQIGMKRAINILEPYLEKTQGNSINSLLSV